MIRQGDRKIDIRFAVVSYFFATLRLAGSVFSQASVSCYVCAAFAFCVSQHKKSFFPPLCRRVLRELRPSARTCGARFGLSRSMGKSAGREKYRRPPGRPSTKWNAARSAMHGRATTRPLAAHGAGGAYCLRLYNIPDADVEFVRARLEATKIRMPACNGRMKAARRPPPDRVRARAVPASV